MRVLSLLIACVCSAALMAGDFAEISQEDLAKAIAAKGVALIDVNGSASWKAGHIPGAIDLASCPDISKCLPGDKAALVVTYCGGPACGAWQRGADAAAALGYTNVKHFKGGISGWKSAGATVEVSPGIGCCEGETAAKPAAAAGCGAGCGAGAAAGPN